MTRLDLLTTRADENRAVGAICEVLDKLILLANLNTYKAQVHIIFDIIYLLCAVFNQLIVSFDCRIHSISKHTKYSPTHKKGKEETQKRRGYVLEVWKMKLVFICS